MMETFDANWVVHMGPNVNAFEKDLEAFANSKSDGADSLDRKVVCMSAGTAAVHLALIGCGVKAGDEVLIFNCAGACLLCFLGYLRFARGVNVNDRQLAVNASQWLLACFARYGRQCFVGMVRNGR